MFEDKGLTACATCQYGDKEWDSSPCLKCMQEFARYGINGKYYKEFTDNQSLFFHYIVFFNVVLFEFFILFILMILFSLFVKF